MRILNKTKKLNIMKMKHLLIIPTIFLVACNSNTDVKFSYKITNPNYSKNRPAIFYTDTLEFNGDSVGYHNSDGSYVLISDSCMYGCKIEKLK